MKFVFLILLCALLSACASGVRSGNYIMLKDGDSVESLAKEFHIPHAAILNANRGSQFLHGEWVFVPSDVGILPRLMGGRALFGTNIRVADFYRGRYLWPLPSYMEISSAYGIERWGRIHKGIDIPAPIGEEILAADDGVVNEVTYDAGGYGNMLSIRHPDGLETIYGHTHRILVRQGQRVFRGQIVALVGNTGRSTGPHLHFEVRRDTLPIDPSPLVLSQ